MNEPNGLPTAQLAAIEARLESQEKSTTQRIEELSKSVAERLDILSEKLANKEQALSNDEKSTTQRVEELSKSVAERLDILSERLANKEEALTNKLSAKDNTVEYVKATSAAIQQQNDALQKQISGRWAVVTGMTGFIAMAFAINFAYGIYQVSEARNAKLALEESGRMLAANAVTYSRVLGELAHADTLVAQAYRETQRTAYADAVQLTSSAIVHLDKAFELTGAKFDDLTRDHIYEAKTCQFVESRLPLPGTRARRERTRRNAPTTETASAFAQSMSPEQLRPAAIEALFAAHDLQARARYYSPEFALTRSKLSEGAQTLIALAGDRWEGYHWAGLAAMEIKRDYEEALACFNKSVSQKPDANKDQVNLAELLFTQSREPNTTVRYGEAKRYSETYLRPLMAKADAARIVPQAPADLVALFYFEMSSYLLNEKSPADMKAFRERLKSLKGAIKLEGSYSDLSFIDYRKGQHFNTLKPEQQQQINVTFECLMKMNDTCDQ